MKIFKYFIATFALIGTICTTNIVCMENEDNQEEQTIQETSNVRTVKVYNTQDVWPGRFCEIPVCGVPQNLPKDENEFKLNVTIDGKIAQPASVDIHEEVIKIQQALGLDHVPAIVYPSNSTVGQINTTNDYAVVILHKKLLKEENFGEITNILCHEFGHALLASPEQTTATNMYYFYKDIAKKSSITGALSTLYTLMPQKIALIKRPACAGISLVCAGLYGFSRLVGESYARIMHKEEFECDMVHINYLAKIPEEKIQAAKDGISARKKYLTDFTSWKARLSQMWYPWSHPSDTIRITQLQKTINEQTALLKTDTQKQSPLSS